MLRTGVRCLPRAAKVREAKEKESSAAAPTTDTEATGRCTRISRTTPILHLFLKLPLEGGHGVLGVLPRTSRVMVLSTVTG